jgi:ketosteroid isomerase-like protein
MKSRVLSGCGLLVVLGVALLRPTALIAQEWSPVQREVLDALQEYTRVSMTGDVEAIMSYFHTQFSAWDYAQEQHVALDGFRESIKYLFGQYKQTSFDVQAAAIDVHGDVAVAHLHYQEVFTDAAGVETAMSGRWTATLVKDQGSWLFLAWSWLQDEA